MRILFNGLAYFGKKLCKELSEFSSDHRYSFYDTYVSRTEQLKYAIALPLADLVISLNGVTEPSGSLDLALKFRKKLWMQWHGTDALIAMERYKKGTLCRKYIDRAVHFSVAPWIQKELESIGIRNTLLMNQWVEIKKQYDDFKELSAYCYLPKGREEFYGWEIIKKLAQNNPEIPFYVVGNDGIGLMKEKNIFFLGKLNSNEMEHLQVKSPIYIRPSKHDGYSYMVVEALSKGAEVLWTMPHENCLFIDLSADQQIPFLMAINKIRDNRFKRNVENIEFVRKNFSKEQVLGNWINKIEMFDPS